MGSRLGFAVDAFLTSVWIGWDALDAGFYRHRLLEKQSHRVGNYGTNMPHHLPSLTTFPVFVLSTEVNSAKIFFLMRDKPSEVSLKYLINGRLPLFIRQK